MKHLLAYAIIFSLVCVAVGCAHLGTADRNTMMQRWQGKPISEHLLWEINSYANWYAPKEGKCVAQTDLKLSILNELGIPAKRGSCTIVRDPYHPVGHAFVVSNGYVLDNGTLQEGIEKIEAVKRSTFGVKDWRVE